MTHFIEFIATMYFKTFSNHLSRLFSLKISVLLYLLIFVFYNDIIFSTNTILPYFHLLIFRF